MTRCVAGQAWAVGGSGSARADDELPHESTPVVREASELRRRQVPMPEVQVCVTYSGVVALAATKSPNDSGECTYGHNEPAHSDLQVLETGSVQGASKASLPPVWSPPMQACVTYMYGPVRQLSVG